MTEESKECSVVIKKYFKGKEGKRFQKNYNE